MKERFNSHLFFYTYPLPLFYGPTDSSLSIANFSSRVKSACILDQDCSRYVLTIEIISAIYRLYIDDGIVKSPISALRFIHRHCGVP